MIGLLLWLELRALVFVLATLGYAYHNYRVFVTTTWDRRDSGLVLSLLFAALAPWFSPVTGGSQALAAMACLVPLAGMALCECQLIEAEFAVRADRRAALRMGFWVAARLLLEELIRGQWLWFGWIAMGLHVLVWLWMSSQEDALRRREWLMFYAMLRWTSLLLVMMNV